MDFRPLKSEERVKLLEALRANTEENQAILLDKQTTRFAGQAQEVPDNEVIAAIRSVPCHYWVR